MFRPLDVVTSLAASITRLGAGMSAEAPAKRPAKRLELYEFEGCPFCRRVREALTDLDLEAVIYPCPKGGKRFRPEVVEMGGKAQFPYLVDPNNGTAMYESADIVAYLYETYGKREPGFLIGIGPLALAGCMVASAMRPLNGMSAVDSKQPKEMLELYSFESSPFCRLVRETLCELELPYILHNVGKGSPGRKAYVKRSGRMMVPYLADPNASKEMFESADICAYLYKSYGA